MSTRVLLVRHGATALTAADRFAGTTDVLLSDEGRGQSARLAERLKGEDLDAVYASPLQRSMETAQLLSAPHRLPVVAEPAFREINYGRWEGMSRSEVENQFAGEYATWQDDPFAVAPTGGEPGISVLSRALPAMRRLVERHRRGCVVVVSHKGTIRLLISSLLGFESRGYRERLDQSPASLTVLDFMDEGVARLRLFNDVSHYRSLPERAPAERWSRG